MTSPVLFEEIATAGGRKAGLAVLNSPQTLNGLSLDMCKALAARLELWASDPAIALVMLRGAGNKSFSAGGDLHGLYKAMQNNTSGDAWANETAREFFDVEYRLDYRIHTYPKPILCWGSGIVMGGGVGLMMGASHRVVTDSTRFAMPEISIGLFPDVGGTWMLSRLPGGVGNFLALTGAQLGAGDCLALGLADYLLGSEDWDALLARIQAAAWPESADGASEQLRELLLELGSGHAWQAGPLQRNLQAIRRACDGDDFLAVCSGITAWAQSDDPWLKRAADTFLAGSPGSARLSFTLLRRARLMSLADVFRQEYIAALQCGVQGDFQEGIRALLIDKDKQPKWNPSSVEQASETWVQRYFQPPWPEGQPHPLTDLGTSAG